MFILLICFTTDNRFFIKQIYTQVEINFSTNMDQLDHIDIHIQQTSQSQVLQNRVEKT